MKVTIFTDKNLQQILQKGWSEDRLVKGQIATLTGRKFQIDIDPSSTIKQLKLAVEDEEGIEVKDQEIRKGKTVLKDENTLDYYFITEKITLLLVNAADIYEGMAKVIKGEDNMETKQKEKPKPTETLVLTEDEANKLNPENKNWWELGHSGSGPKNTRSAAVNVDSPSPQQTVSPRVFGGSGVLGGSSQSTGYAEDSAEHRRELMRRAMEARMKQR